MDAKLKALKVVDLKHILTTAAVSVPAKATKPDLIAKIIASKPALDAYAQLYPPDDLLAPPEDVDWNVDQPESPPSPQKQPPPAAAAPVSTKPTAAPAAPTPAPAPAATTPSQPPVTQKPSAPQETPATSVDEELEKRKKRAERFGVPLVQPREKKPRAPPAKSSAPAVDPKVLEQRAARFGLKQAAPATTTTPAAANGKKRPAQEVDPEEAERRRKRAERFGIPTKS